MKYELLMSSEKIYSFNILQNHSNFDVRVNKSKFIVLLLPILMVSSSLAFNIGTVNAQLNPLAAGVRTLAPPHSLIFQSDQ